MRAMLRSAVLLATLLAAADAPPPHAWLFGAWVGGLYPPPSQIDPRACLGNPTVIVTRDVVMRATLTSPLLIEREIETARTSADGAEIRFTAPPAPASGTSELLGQSTPALPGFGCETPNVLHVHRVDDNHIAFPGCADFPEPLARCPTH